MNKECEIVRDLLPLYVENMASEASRELVENHLVSCESCRALLEAEKKPIEIPAQTDMNAFRQVKKDLRRRTVFPVLLALFLALTVFCGIAVYAVIPVMADYEEMVERIEETEEGVRIYYKDDVYGIVSINNGFYLQKQRLDWFYTQQMKTLRSQRERYFDSHIDEDGSLWYIGKPTGEPDTLVWGSGKEAPDTGITDFMDGTLGYVLCLSLGGAVVMLVLWALTRKKKAGKLFLYTGLLLLCCAVSCLFVTDGHLLERAVRTKNLRFEPLMQKAIAIGAMSVLSFLCCVFGIQTVKAFKK